MGVERIIDDSEQLKEMFEALDIRPLSASDSRLQIDGTMRSSLMVRGVGLGSGTGYVVEASHRHCD